MVSGILKEFECVMPEKTLLCLQYDLVFYYTPM